MKFVNQTVFEKGKGDYFRACIASIFEFPINNMPNFWDKTDDPYNFWYFVNEWMSANLKYKCISIELKDDYKYIIDGLLCIAIYKSKRFNEQHAVIWRNGLVFDPYPHGNESEYNPEIYVILIPIL